MASEYKMQENSCGTLAKSADGSSPARSRWKKLQMLSERPWFNFGLIANG